MHKAVDELGTREGFHGYGPEQGYEWLRHAIAENDFRAKGIQIADDEIFVSDGSKCDCGNILDILGDENRIAVTDPVYPVYVDTNVMAGHTGEPDEAGTYFGLTYLAGTPENGFIPTRRTRSSTVIYLCFPNNPTGAVATREQLKAWDRLRAASPGTHPLRCRVRGVHQRSRAAAFDLRNPRRARMRD
jgi:LL-diaminopimelate aminotransferase